MNQPNPILQSKRNPRSRMLAIKAMCAQCLGCTEDHLEKDFRQSIRECSSPNCSLYELRPFTGRKTALKTTNASDKDNLIPVEQVSCEQANKIPKAMKI